MCKPQRALGGRGMGGWFGGGGGGGERGMRHVHRDTEPAASGSVQQAACWTMAWQRSFLDGPIGVHQAAVVSARGRLPCYQYRKKARAHVTAWSCFAVRLLLGCLAWPPATACGMGVHLGGHGGRQRLRGGKTSRRNHRTISCGRRGHVMLLRLLDGLLTDLRLAFRRGTPRPQWPHTVKQRAGGMPSFRRLNRVKVKLT